MKLGKNLYLAFVFSIAFIGCVSVEKITKKSKEYIDDKDNDKTEKITKLEELWEFIDDISEDEFKIVENLINNNNKPVIIYDTSFDYEFYLRSTIFNSNILIKSNHKEENKVYEKFFLGSTNPNNEEYLPYKICKLKDDIYTLLKFSKKKYGKISNIK